MRSNFTCDLMLEECDALNSEGDALYFDYGHYTVVGAVHFGRKILESGWLAEIIEQQNDRSE